MEETTIQERRDERDRQDAPATTSVAGVREDDLEPHEGLRYIAKLFKALALLLIFMLIAELIIGFQQDGMAALGVLLVEATRLIVFAGFLWGAGDMAVLLIESNHDLRAARILLGRMNGKLDRIGGADRGADRTADRAAHPTPPEQRIGPRPGQRPDRPPR